MANLDAALELARLQLSVIPITPGRKSPWVKWERYQQQRASEVEIAAWWHARRNSSVGVVTGKISGAFVLDIDPKDGGDESLDALIALHGPLPDTWCSRTGSGGRHFWFRMPEGRQCRNTAGKLGQGIDTRGEGGQVVVPPSTHASGNTYAWMPGCSPFECQLADAPAWLLALLDIPKAAPGSSNKGAQEHNGELHPYVRRAVESELGAVMAAQQGTRNDTLNRAAFALGQLVGGDCLDGIYAENRLTGAGMAAGLDADEVKATVASGLAAGRDAPRNIPEGRTQQARRPTPSHDPETGEIHEATAPAEEDLIAPEFSEEALAIVFANTHHAGLRHVSADNKWMAWNGALWTTDERRIVWKLARAVARDAAREMELRQMKGGKAVTSARTVAGLLRLAESDPRIAAVREQWDQHPMLLVTPDCAVDLETGKEQPNAAGLHATKRAAISPASPGVAPTLWQGFLETCMAGDAELIAYLQRMAGYCLTGATSEHALFFAYGTGQNGKSVFINTLSGILGTYAMMAPAEMFMLAKAERHPADLARLRGARLVTAVELESNARWAESKVKSWTGADPVVARHMYGNPFEFQPEFKLLIAGNHKPRLNSVDVAIRRRLHLVPFAVTIPPEQQDKDLNLKLRAEWPAILRWMIDGCRDWRRSGLAPPAAVLDATEEYLSNEDIVGRWLGEACRVDRTAATASGALYENFKAWAERVGERTVSQRRLVQELNDRSFRTEKTRSIRLLVGIRLAQDEELL